MRIDLRPPADDTRTLSQIQRAARAEKSRKKAAAASDTAASEPTAPGGEIATEGGK